ncbi:MAG: OsmC family protein [Bacteroidales bacterium]
METIRTRYLGDLRTEATHVQSGNKIITDAPTDNNGKGEYFSPTDMVATALGSCIFTIMGIKAREHGFSIDGATSKTTKVMRNDPRRIQEVQIEFDFSGQTYSEEEKQILRELTKASPVPRSVSEELIQTISLKFGD